MIEADAAHAQAGGPPPAATHDDPLLDCLAEVTRLHGAPWTAHALGAGLPLVDHRITPQLLPRAAARARFAARLVRRRLDDIPETLLPAILLLHGGRACVLLEVRPGVFAVRFPESGGGIVELRSDDLAAQYSGVVCFARPEFRFERRAAGARERSGRHWFWSAVLDNRALYRDGLIAALLINLFALAMPLFTMNVYDRVVPNNAVETLWVLVIGIGLVIAFNYGLTTLRAHVVDVASKRVDIELSSRIMERVLDLRLEARPASVGSFAANLRSFETVRDFIASATLTTLVDLPFVLLFLLVLAWISPWMIAPPLVAIALVLIVSWVAQVRMAAITDMSFKATSQRNATLVEALAGLESVKAFNAQGAIQRRWEDATRFIANLGGRLRLLSSGTINFVQAMQQAVSVAVVVIGVYQVQNAALSLGGIIAASMIAGRCLAPLGQVTGLLLQFHNARASLGSIDTYMKLPGERSTETAFLDRPAPAGAIEFRNVTFAYPEAAQPALEGVNLRIAAGEKVGIIGRMGSGKTTLEKLVLGLYAPSRGAVLVDGVDIRQLDPARLRAAVSYVPQDPVLFYGTLRHNIGMGNPLADDAAILAAAELAGVTEFANRHPQGFDMLIGERGDSLSGGQRQSIALARALVADAPIVVLDEPTSNMDAPSEAMLRARLQRWSRNRTLLLVTHRTPLLDLVDRLVVIEGGRVVADGPKQQVLEDLRAGRIARESVER